MTIQKLIVGELETNCYIISSGGEYAVIDAGGKADIIADMLPTAPKYIFATHGHFDHMLGVPQLAAEYPSSQVYIHAADADGAGFGEFNPRKEIPALKTMREGDVFTLGEEQIEVLETAGHSEGSVVLKTAGELFTGDTLFFRTIGRTDFPGGSMEAMEKSLARLAALEGDYAVYPGHGSPTALGAERVKNRWMV